MFYNIFWMTSALIMKLLTVSLRYVKCAKYKFARGKGPKNIFCNNFLAFIRKMTPDERK